MNPPHPRTRPSPALAGAAVLAGCVVGPDYTAPEVTLPDAWHQELSDGLEAGETSVHTWWSLLGDPTLTELIGRAAANNLDLEIAWQRVMEARALLGIARGERFPTVNATGDTQRTKFGAAALPGATPPGFTDPRTLNSLGVDATWEIDFWGRVTRSIESANASLQATVENYRDGLVILYAEVALNYIEYRALQNRIVLAESNIDLQESTRKLTQDRFDAQLVSQLDVRQAELNLERTRSFIPRLIQAREQTKHRIEVLIGELPGVLDDALLETQPIPDAPDSAPVILPANLLRQRPDLRRAERELAAQTARIGVATADLYPQFSISGSFAFQSTNSDLFSATGQTWSFGPAVRWNVFDGGRIRNNIEAEESRTEQALAAYRQTVLLAAEEVENGLISYTQEVERVAALERSVTAAQSAVDLVDTLYRTGVADFVNVLDSQRTLVEQQDAMAESEGFRTQALVRVYKALGGGWDPTGEVLAAERAAAEGAPDEDGDTGENEEDGR